MIGNLETGLEPNAKARVFLYFSSESHLHCLRNTLLLSGDGFKKNYNSFDLTLVTRSSFSIFLSLSSFVCDLLDTGCPDNRTVSTLLESLDINVLSHGECSSLQLRVLVLSTVCVCVCACVRLPGRGATLVRGPVETA